VDYDQQKAFFTGKKESNPIKKIEVTTTSTPIFSLVNCTDVTLKNLVFDKTRSHAILLEKSSNITIEQNSFHFTGQDAILAEDVYDVNIDNNTFTYLGEGGIRVNSGELKLLKPGRVIISGNSFSHTNN